MVKKRLLPKDCIELVLRYFKENFLEFKKIKSDYYTGYWYAEFSNNNDIIAIFNGDIGGNFYVELIIHEKEYSLWEYDKSVNEKSFSCEENILYQLNVLKRFLKDL